MQIASNYILVLAQQSDDLVSLKSLFRGISCAVAIATTEAQAVAQTSQNPPCLVLLTGNHTTWSQALVNNLRTSAHACGVTIVAITECHAPSWLPQEENPGIDGFLVKPISKDVLSSVVESASMRQLCYSVG